MATRHEERITLKRPRILIVSPSDSSHANNEPGDSMHQQLSDIFKLGGFESKYCCISDIEEVNELLLCYEPDIAFCSFFRFPGTREGGGYLRDIFINQGVAWVGSFSSALEKTLSRIKTKVNWHRGGVNTPEWFVLNKLKDGSIEGLPLLVNAHNYPYIIRPANRINAQTASEFFLANNRPELYAQASIFSETYGEVIIERAFPRDGNAKEYMVSMIGNGANTLISPVEIVDSFEPLATNDYQSKSIRTYISVSEKKQKEYITSFAQKIFTTSQMRDYSICRIAQHDNQLFAEDIVGQPCIFGRDFEACSNETGLNKEQYSNAVILASIIGNLKLGHTFISVPHALKQLIPTDVFAKLTQED